MLCNQCAGCALAVTTAAADTAECSGGVIAAGTVCTFEQGTMFPELVQ